jgi:hypothetical protein
MKHSEDRVLASISRGNGKLDSGPSLKPNDLMLQLDKLPQRPQTIKILVPIRQLCPMAAATGFTWQVPWQPTGFLMTGFVIGLETTLVQHHQVFAIYPNVEFWRLCVLF